MNDGSTNQSSVITCFLIALIMVLLFGVLITSARPLVCTRVGWDLQVHRAWCWSSEFDDPQPPDQTATPTDYVLPPMPTHYHTPVPTEDLEPTLDLTLQPYPPLETPNPYP